MTATDKFIKIPVEIMESKTLSGNAKILYGYLLNLCKMNGGAVEVKQPKISEATGVGKTCVFRLLNELENSNLINRDQGKYGIIITVPAVRKANSSCSQSELQLFAKRTPAVRKVNSSCSQSELHPYIKNSLKNSIKNSLKDDSRGDVEKSFEKFWEAYPRKVGKKDAVKAWSKIKPDGKTESEILSGLESWKNSKQWKRDGGQYVPYPATFLNAERWKECEPVQKMETPPEAKQAYKPGSYITSNGKTRTPSYDSQKYIERARGPIEYKRRDGK